MNRFASEKVLAETATLLAIYHPAPSYRTHIILMPRRRIRTFLELTPQDSPFMADLVSTVQSLVQQLNLGAGYRLVCNGGAHQDVPYLHFHLIAE